MGYQKIRNTWSGIERYNLNGREHDYNKNVVEKYEPRINLPWNQWINYVSGPYYNLYQEGGVKASPHPPVPWGLSSAVVGGNVCQGYNCSRN